MIEDYLDVLDKTIEAYDNIVEEYVRVNTSPEVLEDIRPYQYKFLKNVKIGGRILDAGCGFGRDVKYFSEYKDNKLSEVLGIDLSKEFLKYAREYATEPNVFLEKMDITDLELPEEYFDGLWCCNAFQHVPSIIAEETLEGFYNVLKQDSLLFLSTKVWNGEGIKEFMEDSKKYGGITRFIKVYEEKEIHYLLEETGFTILTSEIKNNWIRIFAQT